MNEYRYKFNDFFQFAQEGAIKKMISKLIDILIFCNTAFKYVAYGLYLTYFVIQLS